MKNLVKSAVFISLLSVGLLGCFKGSDGGSTVSSTGVDGPGRMFYVLNNSDKDLKASAETVQDSTDVAEWDVPAHSARGAKLPLKVCNVIVMDADFKLTNFSEDLDVSKLGEEDAYYFSGYEKDRLRSVSVSYMYEPRDRGVRPFQGTASATAKDLGGIFYESRQPMIVNWDPVLPGEKLEKELGVLNDKLAIIPFPGDMTEEEQLAFADKYIKSLPRE